MLIPQGTWILAIDGARMQLLRNCGAGAAPTLEVVEEEACPSPPNRELLSDAPGRGHESAGGQRHAYAETDVHQQREQRFAADAMKRLEHSATNGAGVVLIAPPRTLGNLRKQANGQLKGRILAEIPKDIAHSRPAEIATFLQEYWPKPTS